MIKGEIPELDRSGLRKFGLTTAAIVALLFGLLLPWLFGRGYPLWPWFLSGLLFVWALALPAGLAPVYKGWMKVGMALAGLLTGVMLNVSGFDVALEEAQSERTLFLLRVFDVGVPLATSALAILIMTTYRITEQKAYEIRAELERRRGKLGVEATPG